MVHSKDVELANLKLAIQARELELRQDVQVATEFIAELHYAVCTIASKNYLGMVRVFAGSVRRTNPGTPVYVLLVDRVENRFDPANEPYHLIPLEELDNIPNAPHFFFKYDPIELNTAAKPYFLEYLFRKFGIEKICYFDPDIMVFASLDDLWKLLDFHSMVVTLTSPRPTRMNYIPVN